MALIVQKFGGSSVADRDRVMNVARIVAKTHADGNDVVVVVSAQGDTTDELIAKAGEITHDASQREMDMLMSAGEQISVALLSMALCPLDARPSALRAGRRAFIQTAPTPARASSGWTASALKASFHATAWWWWRAFRASTKTMTSPRLGAAALTQARWPLPPPCTQTCARYIRTWTAYTADPRLVPNARKLTQISFDEMLELASLGAQVLNNRSVELAKKYSVELEVRSSLTDVPGTIVREVAQVEGMLIKGVTKNENVAVISLLEVPDVPGMSFNVFSLMAQKKINVGIILQASGRGNNKDLIFTVPLEDVHTATAILQENLQRFGATRVLVDTDVAKVSIVGAGVQSHPGVAAKMFERLYECNINIRMIATSEIKISVIIAKQDADRAVAAVHDAFFQ